jgi:hypothetical protein
MIFSIERITEDMLCGAAALEKECFCEPWSEESLRMLWETEKRFSCVTKTELLPFRKLCTEKYTTMGIEFPLAHLPETAAETVERLKTLWNTWNQEGK